MNLYDLMKNRRSTREFLKKEFPVEIVQKILNAGSYAPSGADQKPYVFIIIDDLSLKEKIRKNCVNVDKDFFNKSPDWFKNWMVGKKISLEKDFLIDAPFLVIVAGDKDKPYWLESTWLSIAYILLAAENEGVSTLTYTPSKVDFINKLLKIPLNFEPVVILPFGFCKEKPRKKNLINKDKIFFNKYQ